MEPNTLLIQIAKLPTTTLGFIVAIAILAVSFHLTYSQKTVTYGPTILTTTGIFATFIGIAYGLADFDPSNIQASVPALLGGLKTAFWASVCGVGAALTIKLRHYFFGVRIPEGESGPEGPTAEDVHRTLQNIHYSLAGDDDATLVSQVKLSRSDANERLDALKKAQSEALLKLSEMGSKALVEALRDVIRDFNERITEQFGDNFKQLNEAVAKLLVWQQEHKTLVEDTTRRHEQMAASISAMATDFETVTTQASAFASTAKSLSSMLSEAESQKTHLMRLLQALGELLNSSKDAIPQIEKKIIEIATQLSVSTADIQRTLATSINENMAIMKRAMEASAGEASKAHQEYMRQSTEMIEKTQKQVSTFDAALAEELHKSLEGLGRQLTALSGRFVEDYTPLTDRLRELVRAAEGVR